jgi:hypothetical protein
MLREKLPTDEDAVASGRLASAPDGEGRFILAMELRHLGDFASKCEKKTTRLEK